LSRYPLLKKEDTPIFGKGWIEASVGDIPIQVLKPKRIYKSQYSILKVLLILLPNLAESSVKVPSFLNTLILSVSFDTSKTQQSFLFLLSFWSSLISPPHQSFRRILP